MGVKYIYGLRQAGDWEFRYIGQTSRPQLRLYAHRCEDANSIKKAAWVASVRDAGAKIEMVILAKVPENVATEVERDTIEFFRSTGHRLTNMRQKPLSPARRRQLMMQMLSERPPDF